MFFVELMSVIVLHFIALVVPGPDFALITRNSLVYSRKIGMLSAVGLGLGALLHVTYTLVGIGFIISQSIILYSLVKYVGAAYLIYIGIKSLRAKKSVAQNEDNEVSQQKTISPMKAIQMGFLTNALNPKATLFFFSVFTQVINPQTPLWVQLVYGAEMVAMTIVWFSFVALVFSNQHLKRALHNVKHHIERATGVVLVALGLRVATTSD